MINLCIESVMLAQRPRVAKYDVARPRIVLDCSLTLEVEVVAHLARKRERERETKGERERG